MTDLYFTDRSVNLQGIATTSQSPIMWGDRSDTQLIDPDTGTSFRTLTGTLHYRRGQNAKIWAMAPEGNFVLYKDDLTGDSVFLEITDIEHDPLAGTHEFTASDAGVDLLDETVGAYKATKAMSIEDYLKLFTNDSGWILGTNEISNLKRTLSWDGDDETALARIISVATQFDNAELSFRFDFDSVTRKVKKYIDVCKRRGADKTVTLYVGKELNNLVTNGTITDLYTSIKGTGGTPDGKDKPITLKGYKWKDPDGRFTLDPDDGILRDTVAVQQWSRALSNDDTHPTGHHIQRVKTYDATTQATLLQSELADLKAHNAPARTYEADVAYLPSGIEVGDTIHLANDDEEQYLQTRLLSLTQTDTGAEATFGDFVLEESQLSPELQQLADTLRQQAAMKQYFPWTRYADDDQGTGMSALASGKKYMAIVWSTNATPSDNPADYAGHWALVGSESTYTHLAYANSDDGTKDFATTPETGTQYSYLGTAISTDNVAPTDPADYTWQFFKGVDGTDGKPGTDGLTTYVHKAWANSVDGVTDFTLTDSADKDYFGVYTDTTADDSSDPTKYSWMLLGGKAVKEVKAEVEALVPAPSSGTAYPETPVTGQQFWLVQGGAAALYQYDGTAWQAVQQDAKMLNAQTFNGMTFNGVNFNGSEFKASTTGYKDEDGNTFDSVQTLDAGGYESISSGTFSTGDSTIRTTIDPAGVYATAQYAGTTYNPSAKYNARVQISPSGINFQWTESSKLQAVKIDPTMLKSLTLSYGKVLWKGADRMGADEVVKPSLRISQCQHGWVMWWSYYDKGAADNSWQTWLVPKEYPSISGGGGSVVEMVSLTGTTRGTKYMYILDDHVKGNAQNMKSDGAHFTMRMITSW